MLGYFGSHIFYFKGVVEMKKIVSGVLVLIMLFCFVGCGNNNTQKSNTPTISETEARRAATRAVVSKINNEFSSVEPLVDLSKTSYDVHSVSDDGTYYYIEGEYYIYYRYESQGNVFCSNNFSVRVSMHTGKATVTEY